MNNMAYNRGSLINVSISMPTIPVYQKVQEFESSDLHGSPNLLDIIRKKSSSFKERVFISFGVLGDRNTVWISWPDFSGLALLLNKTFGDQEGTFDDLTDFDLLGCLLCKRANPSLPPSPPKKVLQMSIISADNLHFLPTEFFFLNSSARLEKSKLYSEKRKGKSQV